MALDQSYINLANMDPVQAGNAYTMYRKQAKKLGAAEIMTPDQFARSGSYRHYDTTPLLKKKTGYNTARTDEVSSRLKNAGLSEQEIGSLRR